MYSRSYRHHPSPLKLNQFQNITYGVSSSHFKVNQLLKITFLKYNHQLQIITYSKFHQRFCNYFTSFRI
ncbi:hypothetical protein Hanom_Chr13g01204151 [Helianthus anomalus]